MKQNRPSETNATRFRYLCDEVSDHLDAGEYGDAERKLLAAEGELTKAGIDSDAKNVSLLACRLVDVGGESGNADLVRKGIKLFSGDVLRKYLDSGSLEYNLGNAKKSLYDIQRGRAPAPYNLEALPQLTEAKNHYWRAVHHLSEHGVLAPQAFVNLANALDQASRVVEAIHWYEEALRINPGFGVALANRGDALMFLNNISGGYSVSLIVEAIRCFEGAAKSPSTLPVVAAAARTKRDTLERFLREEHNWSEESHRADEAETIAEADEHSAYWNYCLDNFVALSEHALYCRCAGARRDDLSILTASRPLLGDFVPRCELLLNRIKSEFCMARLLLFQGRADAAEEHELPEEFEGTYTELWEEESIGLRAEFLRTSFRLCFGILDRIAQGVNELFEIAPVGEVLYFDSFWRPRDQSKEGAESRWEKLNRQDNLGLVALYSLATDLNRRSGEFGFLKETRNYLEHGLLVILDEGANELPETSRPKRIDAKTIGRDRFESLALHLLQFTASAVFSFVFAARIEASRLETDGPSLTVTFLKKNVGKE